MEAKLMLLFAVCLSTISVEAKLAQTCKPCHCSNITADCSNKSLYVVPNLPENIEIVKLNNNKLGQLNASTLAPISNLNITRLEIRQNNLVEISEDTFSAFSHLQHLNLGNNVHLNKTSLAASLSNVPNTLQHLWLDDIALNATDKLFARMIGSNVQSIDLSSNQILYLRLSHFQHLNGLKKLVVSHNSIQLVEAENFSLPALQDLNLANNKIADLPPSFCTRNAGDKPLYLRLRNIDLSNNLINKIDSSKWECLTSLEKLSLCGNVISHFTKNAFANLPSLQNLQLCNMADQLKNIDQLAFNSTSLKILNLDNNVIRFYKLKVARDMFNHVPNLETLILSHNSFRKYGRGDFEAILKSMLAPLVNLIHLDLSHSKLDNIPSGLFSTMKYLRILNLDDNGLANLYGTFVNMTTLTKLLIQNNLINTLTKESFPDELMSSLQSLNLAQNPFQCTCELLWFRTFIGNSGTIGKVKLENWPKYYTCNTPPNMYRKLLKLYNPTKESCERDRMLLYSLVSCATFMVVAITTAIVVYKNIWYIRYWRYKFKRSRTIDNELQPLLEQIIYDAYVIYAEEDVNFVIGCFRQLLEEKLNYKIFLGDRDLQPGLPKVDAIADGIYASRSVLAIVSNSFLKNDWCMFQLDISVNKQIENKKDMLTLVIKEDLNFEKLNKAWCVLLTKLKTAQWCDDESKIQGKLFIEEMKQRLKAK